MLPTPMGGMELLIILVIILLFFGAKRVPELGRSLGKGVRELRQGAAGEDDPRGERSRSKEVAGATPRSSGEQDL
jgi:sec-independent protein translocase protein TatA